MAWATASSASLDATICGDTRSMRITPPSTITPPTARNGVTGSRKTIQPQTGATNGTKYTHAATRDASSSWRAQNQTT